MSTQDPPRGAAASTATNTVSKDFNYFFRQDILRLFKEFNSLDSYRFTDFAKTWTEMKFYQILSYAVSTLCVYISRAYLLIKFRYSQHILSIKLAQVFPVRLPFRKQNSVFICLLNFWPLLLKSNKQIEQFMKDTLKITAEYLYDKELDEEVRAAALYTIYALYVFQMNRPRLKVSKPTS